MPQFEGSRIIANSRSNATLTKSPGDSPAERWIIDPDLRGLFEYHYGGWPRSHVVIPKGTIVSPGAEQKLSYRVLKNKPVLTFAGHGKNAIGVAPYNFYRRFDEMGEPIHDVFEADDFVPGIITREYIEVPYIPDPAAVYTNPATVASELPSNAKRAMRFYWGCATNLFDMFKADNLLEEGDFVKAGPFGKFVKWNKETDGFEEIVGQVFVLETDLPPEGWLQWVTPEVEKGAGYADGSLRDPFEPTAPPTPEGPYYNADYKWPLTSDYRSAAAWKTYNGIPGLTDGANMIKRRSADVLATGETTVAVQLDQSVAVTEVRKVTLGDQELAAEDYVFDSGANTVTVTVETPAAADTLVAVEYVVDLDMTGVVPAWDHVGSIGAARILLKF